MNSLKGVDQASLWERYGRLFIIGSLIILIAFTGIQGYGLYLSRQSEKASIIYDHMLTSIREKQFDKVGSQAQDLVAHYAKTPYGPLAALMLARLAFDEKNLDKAIEHLRFAMNASDKGPVQHVARVRLARVLGAKQKYDEALTVLNPKKRPEGYITLYEEAKGDIYTLKNEPENARIAYDTALQAAPPGAPVTPLQLKQTDITTPKESS